VGETDARAQTASPTLDALSFPAMELYAMPAATATREIRNSAAAGRH
jgi:HK97 family phage major capsid protein